MYGNQVLDKDGICAAAVMAEMASYLYNENTTVTGHLDALYQRYVLNTLLALQIRI